MERSEIISILYAKIDQLKERQNEYCSPNSVLNNTVNEIYKTAIGIYSDCIGLLTQDTKLIPILDFKVGDSVEAPDPDENDTYTYGGWIGTIDSLKTDTDGTRYAVVTDGDDESFCIDLDRLINVE